jgi:hypothetical protein
MKKIILIAVLLLSIRQTFAHSGHGCHKDVSEDIPRYPLTLHHQKLGYTP